MSAGWWREKGSPIAQLMAVSVLIGASIGLAAKADADPTDNYITVYAETVCSLLDRNNSLQGVIAVGDAIYADGFGPDAGRIIVDSVTLACPRHWGLLQDFANVYATDQARVLR